MRILVVDDNISFQETVRQVLAELPSCRVVAQAVDGWEALGKAYVLKPDLVLLDVHLEGLDGLEVARHLSASMPGIYIVMLLAEGSEEYREAAVACGADACVVKEDLGDALVTLMTEMMANSSCGTPK